MKASSPVFLSELGIINALGNNKEAVFSRLMQGDTLGLIPRAGLINNKHMLVGEVTAPLPVIGKDMAKYNTKCNRLLLAAYEQIAPAVQKVISTYGKDRIGVILGSSTSGIAEGEQAFSRYLAEKEFPDGYYYKMQEMSAPAEFLAEYLGLENVAYVISTACSSSAKAFASARNMIELGLCDAVLVGGADSLCNLTLHGFASLESISEGSCNPFSKNRSGIVIGEGAALFLMTKEKSNIQLLGVGESSDAHHITAPHPEGDGAARAMRAALDMAGLQPEDIHYVNLHGTATPANDKMESIAMNTVFKNKVPCSSTKALPGHTLGAAG
ncbi:MAG: beta-ketoacyl-ACP synthase, partial [Patescibacteria group bacterium]